MILHHGMAWGTLFSPPLPMQTSELRQLRAGHLRSPQTKTNRHGFGAQKWCHLAKRDLASKNLLNHQEKVRKGI